MELERLDLKCAVDRRDSLIATDDGDGEVSVTVDSREGGVTLSRESARHLRAWLGEWLTETAEHPNNRPPTSEFGEPLPTASTPVAFTAIDRADLGRELSRILAEGGRKLSAIDAERDARFGEAPRPRGTLARLRTAAADAAIDGDHDNVRVCMEVHDWICRAPAIEKEAK